MSALRSDDDGALLRVLFGVVAADELDADDDADEGLASVRTAYADLTGRALTDADVEAGRAAARSEGTWLAAAQALARELDDDGTQRLFAAAFTVALADGFVLDEADRVLSTLAAALGMNEHEYRLSVDKLLAAAH
ncbi:MAG: TerB family tellurite resistance protein [Myxococcales bacterium]|nr:TerB family tellurite resistance protein [Myxococcales bacterium]